MNEESAFRSAGGNERDLEAAAQALSRELGAAEPGYAQIVAVERLNEMHAAGTVSDEDFAREKKRLQGQG